MPIKIIRKLFLEMQLIFLNITPTSLIWEDIFNHGASAAAIESFEWVQVGIDVPIPNRKYQVEPNPFPRFSVTCDVAM